MKTSPFPCDLALKMFRNGLVLFALFILVGLGGCQPFARSNRVWSLSPQYEAPSGELHLQANPNDLIQPGSAIGPSQEENTNDKPVFILAFIPLNWQADLQAFEQEATRQSQFFIRESGITVYFHVNVLTLDSGPQNIALDSDHLIEELVRYGQGKVQADRFIGLTDGDLIDDEIADMEGWTDGVGSLGLVLEAGNEKLLAHEMGHTLGLCDEYNYSDWSQQNKTYSGGCPNPYPPDCPKLITQEIICIGERTEDGRFSLMGPAGLDGNYGFNTKSLKHLSRVFNRYSQNKTR